MNRSLFAITLYMLASCPVVLTTTCFAARPNLGWQLPPGTAIPVEFTHTLKADKVRAGDPVEAKTMQVVHLGRGHDLPKGSLVLGHVIMAHRVRRGISPSVLAFRFDRIVTRQGVAPVRLYVRALANTFASSDASYPTPPSDINLSEDSVLIGGDHVNPSGRSVYSSENEGLDVVGTNLKEGIFERLRTVQTMNGDSLLSCDGTVTEQSVAIYSGSTCGLYGFDMEYLAQTGKQNRGTVEIDSKYFTIKLYATSTALLQVAPTADDSKP